MLSISTQSGLLIDGCHSHMHTSKSRCVWYKIHRVPVYISRGQGAAVYPAMLRLHAQEVIDWKIDALLGFLPHPFLTSSLGSPRSARIEQAARPLWLTRPSILMALRMTHDTRFMFAFTYRYFAYGRGAAPATCVHASGAKNS